MSVSSSSANAPVPQYVSPLSNEPSTKTVLSSEQATTGAPRQSASPHEKALIDAYIGAVQNKTLGKNPGLIKVPPLSVLGQWLGVYRAQVEHPVVQGWMQEQKIDQTALLTVNPRNGTLTATVEGDTKSFSLTDNSGWGQVSGPLLEAAKVIAPGTIDRLQMRFGDDYIKVRAGLVANFEGAPLPSSLRQAREQIRGLEQNQGFDPIPSDDPVRPAQSRSAHALEKLKLNAETFYAQAPQALAYRHLATDVANALPNVRAHAKMWAESVLFKLTGQQVDADTLYLNRFNGSQSASTVTGWEHMNEEPTSSLRLPDALLKNFSENDWTPGNLDSEAGIYKDGPGKSKAGGYGAKNQYPVAPSDLMHTSWQTDFQTLMTQKIDDFWNTRSTDYRTSIKGEFAYQARKQLKTAETRPSAEQALQAPEHRFSREDYRLVMGAVSNLPLDENVPLNVEQLRAEAPVKGVVQTHAFNIKGFLSNDIVRFSADDGGRQVLYIPGAEPAFLRFDSLGKLDQWVINQTKDPKKREALLSHFPLISRQDHEPGTIERLAKAFMPVLWFTNVGTKTEGLDTTFEKLASGKLKDPTFDGDGSHIEGDVFANMASASKERMTSDADVMIKSNSEVKRDTWLNDITVAAGLLAKLAPIAAPVAAVAAAAGLTELALGAQKQASGDTLAERNDGASKAFDGLLNTLFSVAASGSAEDPFVPPEEKPLTPTRSRTPRAEPSQTVSSPNRLQPSQTGNISQYAVPGGEQLIENAARNTRGIYQIKDATTGADRWFIPYTDTSGSRQIFEIKGNFKLSNDYVQIIDQATGKPVMTVNSDGNGEWVRSATNGGLKWPWRSPSSSPSPSPTPSTNENLIPKFTDLFTEIDEEAASGAKRFDEVLDVNEQTPYRVSARGYEESGTLKRKLNLEWDTPAEKFEVFPSEKAGHTDYSTTSYSDNFINDINRDDYVVVKPAKSGDITFKLDAGGDSFEAIRKNRIAQFEQQIPDEDLRSRMSEVAHQGMVFPANAELVKTLKEGYGAKVLHTQYFFDYDPLQNEQTVRVVAKWYINDLTGDDPRAIPHLEITTTRTFTIRASNEVSGERFKIDENAPTVMEASLPSTFPVQHAR